MICTFWHHSRARAHASWVLRAHQEKGRLFPIPSLVSSGQNLSPRPLHWECLLSLYEAGGLLPCCPCLGGRFSLPTSITASQAASSHSMSQFPSIVPCVRSSRTTHCACLSSLSSVLCPGRSRTEAARLTNGLSVRCSHDRGAAGALPPSPRTQRKRAAAGEARVLVRLTPARRGRRVVGVQSDPGSGPGPGRPTLEPARAAHRAPASYVALSGCQAWEPGTPSAHVKAV